MKRLIHSIFTFIFVFTAAFAQMSVKSFEELPFDLDASTHYPKKDANNQQCAIIKIFTTQKGFSFDNGTLGIVDVEYDDVKHAAEIWVYVPESTMKLKISHPQLGHIQNSQQNDGFYWFPRVKAGKCYKMELTSGNVRTVVEEAKQKAGWFVLNSTPSDAEVWMCEEGGEYQYYSNTPFQKRLPYGRYNFRLKKAKYHDEVGVAVIDQAKVTNTVPLLPAFGSIYVTSSPQGADVYLDGENTGKTTPCTLTEILSGNHELRLRKENYTPQSKEVTVSDGQTSSVTLSLAARFAHVTITSLPGASIKINNEVKGRGSFTGNLVEGLYEVEVSLASHRTATKQIEVFPGVSQTVEITPTPIYGSLDVMTTPMEVNVTINGKNYGQTPLTIEELLIGEYDVELSKPGYATETRHVTITENTSASINATLQSGRSVTIATDKSGDEIFVDGVRVGVSPCAVELAFGTHKITAQRGEKTTIKNITVEQDAGAIAVSLAFGLSPKWNKASSYQRSVLQRLIDNMVKVKGGRFSMGATSEQGYDAHPDEKPVSTVYVDEFYINKFEVTQTEWEAVMGNNPSYTKGGNCPVDRVNWNDCQEFIRKLNSLTGLNFCLPTEAEWEYAARGGNKSKGYKYAGSNNLSSVAWYQGNSGSALHSVGSKSANELGLYDMSGNACEWCSNWYNNTRRAIRGGGCGFGASSCRVSSRYHYSPTARLPEFGLRLAHKSDD